MVERRRQVRPWTPSPGPERGNCRRGYKENLPSACITEHRGPSFPRVLDGRRWVFLQEERITQNPREASLPRIHRRVPPPPGKKRQEELLPRLPGQAQQAGKVFSENKQAREAPHPLALYPHLEEALPAQLLLKVLEVLDPEKKLADIWAYCQDARKTTKEPTKLLEKHSAQAFLGPSEKTPVSHSGQWLYEEKPSGMDLLNEDSPFPYENVRREVRVFCTWATTLGSPSIDEEFIMKQFDMDHQTKPACNVLQVLKLQPLPPELRKSVGLNKRQQAELFQKPEQERRHRKPQNPNKPKWVKIRYGAWYLNPKLWKKQRADEPLVDPKDPWKAQEETCKKELQAQEELLADLHGIVAFKDFILSRGYRMPRFLENMNIGKKSKHMYNKTPIKLTQA